MVAFEKRECDRCNMVDFFPLADWEMLWPVYARETCVYLTMIAWAYVVYREEMKEWSFVAFMLVVGWYIDFALRANFMWFRVFGYPFGYTSFAALIFALCLLKTGMNGLSRSR